MALNSLYRTKKKPLWRRRQRRPHNKLSLKNLHLFYNRPTFMIQSFKIIKKKIKKKYNEFSKTEFLYLNSYFFNVRNCYETRSLGLQFDPSNCWMLKSRGQIAIRENRLSKSREQIAIQENGFPYSRERINNQWVRITYPWERIAQFDITVNLWLFWKYPCPFRAFVLSYY